MSTDTLPVIDPALLLELFDEPVVIHRAFVALTGSLAPALFLSALVQLLQERAEEDGEPTEAAWVQLTQAEWHERTFLSRYELERARTRLVELGLISQQRSGVPARLKIRLNVRTLAEALRRQAQARFGRAGLADVSRSSAP